jgi:hypothetical protein
MAVAYKNVLQKARWPLFFAIKNKKKRLFCSDKVISWWRGMERSDGYHEPL